MEDPIQPATTSSGNNNNTTSALEATELSRLESRYSRVVRVPSRNQSNVGLRQSSSGGDGNGKNMGRFEGMKEKVKVFWGRQVSVIVPHEACRDHLALERTFLAYLRTSLGLSSLGVAVAQLFRLQHTPNPNPIFGFYVLGKPLACICQCGAIYCLILGVYRTWRLQNAMVRGKAISGGIELVILALGAFIFLVMFFVLVIAVDIDKND